MNKEALLRVADIVESVSEERFDMGGWREESACGPVRCAVGWAATDPWFNDRGFALNQYDRPAFLSNVGWNAVKAFFCIALPEALTLFYPRHYEGDPTPAEVATRIRQFVATEGALFDDK